MGRIHILDENVAARIAAGEVIERPASIVKELVENSIDAGASAVSISIENGGLRRIQVSDNGIGIEKEDIPLTVLKHATSKIEKSKDLEHISSMGFRGEALFSIAAVSMFTLRSRPKGAETGNEVRVTGGKVDYIREAGLPEGTTAIAENLFFNTPARLRFLKSVSAETGAVSDIVSRFILGNPSVSFRYSSNGTVIYHSPGNGRLIDALVSVYGKDIRNNTAYADMTFNGVRVYGYIGKHTFYQKSGRNQSLYINGRYVRSDSIRRAATKAYGERMLKGTYPFYVLFIDMPFNEVDVNVHPNKMQVHFRDQGKVEYVVGEAVARAVEGNEQTQVLDISAAASVSALIDDKGESISSEKQNETGHAAYDLKDDKEKDLSNEEKDIIRELLPREKKTDKPEIEQGSLFADDGFAFAENRKDRDAYAAPVKDREEPVPLSGISSAVYIGTAFNTYPIFEMGEVLYLIDQHAAHERMIYDALMADGRVISQQLLIPEIMTFPHDQMLVIEENMEMLAEMGIDAEPFGNLSIRVTAVPQIVGEINIRAFFEDILEGAGDKRNRVRLIKDRVARAACKRAVKAGWKLSEDEIMNILKEITVSGVIPHCPHGRPLAIAITKTDLEKGFKRIV
ncbi:MAG: DNA mismatch repair endonuclease MutL [Clostridia bacterium]|nr:DNA mismatch repair endonuclease MutL [Christensenellaceae bacterium]MBR6239371.1 DNA mismatch repair endonuclease MutL [Clostridia bacterium]